MDNNTQVLYRLRYREMQFTGKGDPAGYQYHEAAKSLNREVIDELVAKYNLHLVDPEAYIEDGYEIYEEKLVDHVDYDYVVTHSDRKHVNVQEN